MDTFLMYFLFAAGLALIIKGGDFFVDAAVWIAKVSHIPQFLIGATVVSLATTMPEIFVSVIAASQGKTDMATGNAIGSVIANTGLIFALGILFLPSAIRRRQFVPKSIVFLAAVIAVGLFCAGGYVTLYGSIGLFMIFAVFIAENIKQAKGEISAAKQKSYKPEKKETAVNVLKFLSGAAGIVIGSHLLVENGSAIAESLGVAERIISLTAVAIGTSLPELVTTVTAIIKRQSSLSAGNIIGANIIDMTLILPMSAFVSGGILPVGQLTFLLDVPFCLLVAGIVIIPTIVKGRFMRWQGAAALAAYGAYVLILLNI